MRAPVGGWKAEVVRGWERMWRDVRVGLGDGACGEMWWRVRVEEGPEERRRGCRGWKEREVMADWRVGVSEGIVGGGCEGGRRNGETYVLNTGYVLGALDIDDFRTELLTDGRGGG